MKKILYTLLISISCMQIILAQTTAWNFATDTEGWSLANNLTGSVNEGILNLTSTGSDPFIVSANNLNIPAADYKYVLIRMQNGTSSTVADLYWTTSSGLIYASIPVKANDDNMRYYLLDLSKNPRWKGAIQSLRFDPARTVGAINIDFIRLAGAYGISAIDLPMTIEAENYNRGGEGNQHRTSEGVDIYATSDTTGQFDVNMKAGEWMEYMVKVPGNYKYFFDLRVSATVDSTKIHFELDGLPVGNTITVNNTIGATNWQTIRSIIDLPQGLHVLRLVADDCPGEFNINNIAITPHMASLVFSSPGESGSYRSLSDVNLVVSPKDDIAASVNKIEFYLNGEKLSEDAATPYEHTLSALSAGYYIVTAMAINASGIVLDSAITELFVGNSKVGMRALPRGFPEDTDRNIFPNNPGGYFSDFDGQYPFVAENMDVITSIDFGRNFKGDFKTRKCFIEHYLPFDRDWIDPNPNTSPLIQTIKQIEAYGFDLEHILICREAELYGSGRWGPFPEDSRILYQRDVDDFRKLFKDAFAAGIIDHNNYKLIQMCISPKVYYTNPKAAAIIKTMDGVCFESHQYNVHWPLDQGIEKDIEATNKGIRWTLTNGLDYVFYFGPWLSPSCPEYYDDAVKDWMQRYWNAGMPKHFDKMHFYLNNFPHSCGASNPVAPETKAHSYTWYAKWFIEEVGTTRVQFQENAWEFTDDLEGWNTDIHGGSISQSNDKLKFTVNDVDPHVYKNVPSWEIKDLRYLWMKVKNETTANSGAFSFFPETGDSVSLPFILTPTDTGYRDILFTLDTMNFWTPELKLNGFRLQPVTGNTLGDVYVDFIRFLKDLIKVRSYGDAKEIKGLGKSLQLFADEIPLLNSIGVNWSVDNQAFATINASGLLTGVSAGYVTVTATAKDGSGKSGTIRILITDTGKKTAWEFTNDLEKWDINPNGGTVSHSEGAMKFNVTAGDPYVNTNVVSWKFDDLKYIWMRVKNETAGSGGAFYFFPASGGFDLVSFLQTPKDSLFRDVFVDLRNTAVWKKNTVLSSIRLDPNNGGETGNIYVDFIRFMEELVNVSSEGAVSTIVGLGKTLQMYAQVMVSEDAVDVTWKVDKPEVASIDSTGLLTSLSNGVVEVTATAKDGSGVSGSAKITVSIDYTSVGNIKDAHLKIYPNPVGKTLNIDNASDIQTVAIVNAVGKVVLELSNMHSVGSINTGELKPGVYLLRATYFNGNTSSARFIKN